MLVIILGVGSVGFQLAKQLIAENKDVVLIEKNTDKAKYASNYLDCLIINEDGNNLEVLKQAGIEKADFFISVTEYDEINMIACGLVSSHFNVPCKIARIRNPYYNRTKLLENDRLDITYIVNPEEEAGQAISKNISFGATSDVIFFKNSDIQMRNFLVDENSIFIDKSLITINQEATEKFLISLISRDDEIIIPSGQVKVKKGDLLYLVSHRKNLDNLFSKEGKKRKRIKNVIIVGGGKIGVNVAKMLINSNVNVKIIEKSYAKCKELSTEFAEALIINADISDESIFEEEQLYTSDLIICTTENSEINILAAIYAKRLGVSKAISVVSQNNYLTMASTLGIDATVSPKNSCVDRILKYIRKGNIKSIHSLFDARVEVIEFRITQESELAGNKLKNLKMPENSLILAVNRKKESHIPNGNFELAANDSIITISTKESVAKLEDMFNK